MFWGVLISVNLFFVLFLTRRFEQIKGIASSGNPTRAARVAGEHSTTEPTMLIVNLYLY